MSDNLRIDSGLAAAFGSQQTVTKSSFDSTTAVGSSRENIRSLGSKSQQTDYVVTKSDIYAQENNKLLSAIMKNGQA